MEKFAGMGTQEQEISEPGHPAGDGVPGVRKSNCAPSLLGKSIHYRVLSDFLRFLQWIGRKVAADQLQIEAGAWKVLHALHAGRGLAEQRLPSSRTGDAAGK